MFNLKKLLTSKRTKKLLVLVMIVAGLAAVQPVIWPWITLLAQDTQGQGANNLKLEEVKQATATIQQSYEKQRLLLEQMITVVPREAKTIQIIQRLEAKAAEAGVVSEVNKITDETPEVTEITEATAEGEVPDALKDSGIIPLEVEMHSSGKPANLMSYLASLENLRELSLVREVRLNAPRGRNIETGDYQMDIEMTFYLSQ